MNTDENYPSAGSDDTRGGAPSGPDYSWNPIVGPGPYQDQNGRYQDQTGTYQGQAGAGSPYGQPSAAAQPMDQPSASYPPAYATTTATPAPPARRPKQRRLGLVLAAAAISAVIGAGAGISAYAVSAEGSGSAPITVTTAPAAQTAVTNGTVEAATAKINPSVVTITVSGAREADVGSGVILDTHGHIVTNAHVVSAAQSGGTITVTLQDGRTASASVVGLSNSNDLAVIKIDSGVDVSQLKPAVFAKSSSVKLGQSVVAVGAPLGLSDTVTSGVVSATERPVRSGDNNDAVYLAVQTDTAINPGNSGGPLVDLNGSVVGINSSIASTSTGQQGQQPGSIGIGFAIPSQVVTRVAADLINNGSAPDASLGVEINGNDTSLTDQTTSTGVTLAQVQSGSPAEQAGLKAGDVVTKVDDFPTTTADGLIAAVRYYAPGSQVTITYTRDGTSHTAHVTLGQTS